MTSANNLLKELYSQVIELKGELNNLKLQQNTISVPDWLPISKSVCDMIGYKSRDGLLGRLKNGNFNPEADFRKNQNRWEISRDTFVKLQSKKLLKDKIALLSVPHNKGVTNDL